MNPTFMCTSSHRRYDPPSIVGTMSRSITQVIPHPAYQHDHYKYAYSRSSMHGVFDKRALSSNYSRCYSRTWYSRRGLIHSAIWVSWQYH